MVPQLLTPHRQMETHVQVLAHAIWTFFVFRSYQDPHQGQQQALGQPLVELVVPLAFVALVRKDVLDHAIWTVAVVSHPVVTDHHHRNRHSGVFTQAAEHAPLWTHGCRQVSVYIHTCPEQDVKLLTWPRGMVDALESQENVSTDNVDTSSAVVNG